MHGGSVFFVFATMAVNNVGWQILPQRLNAALPKFLPARSRRRVQTACAPERRTAALDRAEQRSRPVV